MKILVVNCGSSSIKYQLFDMPSKEVLAKGLVERIGESKAALHHESGGTKHIEETEIADHQKGMRLLLAALTEGETKVIDSLDEVGAVGHRVVHGGEAFSASAIIDDKAIQAIEDVAALAPLHNPPNLVGIRAAQETLPNIPHVAVFDTAFHASIPKEAYTYAFPYELYEKHGVRRYGFHGTSHLYVAKRAAEMLGKAPNEINCITLHLGNGCSAAAVKQGKSIDTSMGLTPLEGLVMGTRTGDFDPAILFYLEECGYDSASFNKLCNKQSGLLGISGESNDMRTLIELAGKGHERAKLAIDIFSYRIKKYIGSYAAVLGRLDAVVFTGGIGENTSLVRASSCSNLQSLGIELDENKNEATHGCEAAIQSASSKVQILIIPTNEEVVIADDTYTLTN